MSLTVELTPQLEKHVRDKVKSGAYRSASEYVREAIRLKQKEERFDESEFLRREIRKGFEEIEEGRFIDIRNEGELAEFFKSARSAAMKKQKARRTDKVVSRGR